MCQGNNLIQLAFRPLTFILQHAFLLNPRSRLMSLSIKNINKTRPLIQWEVEVEFAATAVTDNSAVFKVVVEGSGSIEESITMEIYGKFLFCCTVY